jgi:predicted permease
MRSWLRRVAVFFRRRGFDDDLKEELQFHLEMKQQALEDDGVAPADAGRAAQRAIGGGGGGTLRVRERSRDVWIAPAIDALGQDVRHAVRLLRRNPGFAVTALCTLALGIGLNTAIFSIVYGVLLKPLNYRDPSRLVGLLPQPDSGFISWTPGDYHALSEANQTFEGIAGYTGLNTHLTGQGEPRQLWGLEVTPNFLDVLGVDLALGRGFQHDAAGAPGAAGAAGTMLDANSVIISDRVWRALFNGDPSVLGRAITLDGESKTIIGVLKPAFAFHQAAISFPHALDALLPNDWPDRSRRNAFLPLIGRLRPGVTYAQADTDVTRVLQQIARTLPPNTHPPAHAARVVDLHAQVVGETTQRLLLVLSAAVALVLLIVCVNIANLQLARWSSRRTELSVRLALGAGRRRIVRQLLTESLVLAFAGGALGTLVAYGAVPLLLSRLPTGQLPRMEEISVSVSTPVLIFSVVLSVSTGVLFGLLPALRQSTLSHADDLRGGVGRTTAGRQTERLRNALVTGQVALTLVLLVSAGLLMHSFIRLLSVPTGFNGNDVVTVTVMLPDRLYTTPAPMKAFTRAVLDRSRAIPGVSATSVGTMLPFNSFFFIRGDFAVEGQPTPRFYVGKPKIGPDYFKTLGIPMVEGREFRDEDTAEAPKVAIVSDSVAQRLWPKGHALGQRVRVGGNEWHTVVGVAGDVRQFSLQNPIEPTIYVPYEQEPGGLFLQTVTFVARTQTPDAAANVLQRAIREVAPDLPIARVASMQTFVSDSVAQPRLRTMLIGSFALSALLIATLGIYGVMTYAVTQRRREIGIRMAIGAEWNDVVWLVLRRALLIVAAGAIIGIAASFAVTRTLTSFLFEVTPNDPIAIVGVTMLLVVVGITAAWLPARRAAQTDPVEALRVE